MKKITSITEAFSMQPNTHNVMNEMEYKRFKNWVTPPCAEIKLEQRDPGDGFKPYYVGYDFNGEVIFIYHEKSVNVHYGE
jgi:hypothetical protein